MLPTFITIKYWLYDKCHMKYYIEWCLNIGNCSIRVKCSFVAFNTMLRIKVWQIIERYHLCSAHNIETPPLQDILIPFNITNRTVKEN